MENHFPEIHSDPPLFFEGVKRPQKNDWEVPNKIIVVLASNQIISTPLI